MNEQPTKSEEEDMSAKVYFEDKGEEGLSELIGIFCNGRDNTTSLWARILNGQYNKSLHHLNASEILDLTSSIDTIRRKYYNCFDIVVNAPTKRKEKEEEEKK